MAANFSKSEIPAGLYDVMMQVDAYINNLDLDRSSLELMRFRVAQINGCAYCLDMHYKEAINVGEKQIRLYSVSAWHETPYYSDKERALLAWTDTITLISENEISDKMMNDMQLYYTKEEIANLTLAVTQINSWTRLGKTFAFEPGHYKPGNH